jgi:hypothetical protein
MGNDTLVVSPNIRSEVDQQIAQGGAEAAAALRQLAAIQRARTPAPSPSVAEADLPEALRAKATFEWSGPAQGLVRELASRVGYAYRETGNPTAVPPNVNISLRETMVGQALVDVGLQVQRVATLVVDPDARVIEFRHDAGASQRQVITPGGTRTPRRNTANRVRH